MRNQRFSDYIILNPDVEVEVSLECSECGSTLQGRPLDRGNNIEVEWCISCQQEMITDRLDPTYEVLHKIWYQKKAEKGYTSYLHPRIFEGDSELLKDWRLLSYEAKRFLIETDYLLEQLMK